MARKIKMVLGDDLELNFSLNKFTKSDIYGKKSSEKRSLDYKLLQKISITEDGIHILPKGAVSSQYIDSKGNFVNKSNIIKTDEDGNPLEITTSMFSKKVKLKEIPMEDIFRYNVIRTYILETSENFEILLKKCRNKFELGKFYKFTYAYRDTTNPHDAILIPKNNSIVVIVADYAPLKWATSELDLEKLQILAEEEEDLLFEEAW